MFENKFKLLTFCAALTFSLHYLMLVAVPNRVEKKLIEINCGKYPKEEDILIDNIVWQVLQMPQGFVKFLNAYLDLREKKPVVRINANGMFLNISFDIIYCQFWYDGVVNPIITRASEYKLMYVWGTHPQKQNPYLITCPLDVEGKIPRSVSLTANPCDKAENLLHIIDEQPVDGIKKKFGVCSKYFTYESRSQGIRFIEWVHILKILGADKIYFYNRYVHRDFLKVLDYMEEKQLIRMWPYLEPSGISDMDPYGTQIFMLQSNVLNDCFYRIRNLYEYVVILDPDEVIMPVLEADHTWEDIMNHFKDMNMIPDGIRADNFYYPNIGAEPIPDVPSYHYMLQHIQRSVNYSGIGVASKSFHVPGDIKVTHNHCPLSCLTHDCWCNGMPMDIAQLSHYRDFVDDESFNATIEDKLMWKFKDELIEAVRETLDATKFIP